MQVGIDISAVAYQRGVSRYTSNLVTALLKQKDINLCLYGYNWRQQFRLKQFVNDLRGEFPLASHHWSAIIEPYPPTLMAKFWQWGWHSLKKTLPQIDVFHSWDWLQPPDRQLPLVSTIHDLAMLKYPDTAHPAILKRHRKSWQTLHRSQAQIITVSHSTKRDIIKFLNFPEADVHVIYEALPGEVWQTSANLTQADLEAGRSQWQLTKPYILFVGTREPRKNLLKLIAAWQPLRQNVDLVIAGESGWEDLRPWQHLQQQLKLLGHVSDKELGGLYSEAELLAYHSLDEGFGLPILEAFHYGTPVLTSNVSAMPEVAGNAAVLVNPQSVEEIRQGLMKLMGESPSEQRQRLQKMIIRLHSFSWSRTAEQTVKVYQRALHHHF